MKARHPFMLRLGRFARGERGTQLVELAIVLPIFVLMFAAIAEFGRFFYTYTTLTKATRVGARYLMSQPVGDMDENAKRLVLCGNPTVCADKDAVISGLKISQVKIDRAGGVVGVLPDTINVRIEGFYYQPIFDLGKLTGSSTLSLKIQVAPSTMMQALSTTPVI
jgi:Flp pilus assembly protein TadG